MMRFRVRAARVLASARVGLVLLGLGAWVRSGGNTAFADDWASAQHDPQHTGWSDSQLDPATLAGAWASGGPYHSPLIVGNAVFGNLNRWSAGGTSFVSSFDLGTGAVNWTSQVTAFSMGHANGLLAYTTGVTQGSYVYGRLNVLDAASGSALYSVPVTPINGAMTIAPDGSGQSIAYVSDGRGTLAAVQLGATSGSVLWTATGLLAGSSAPSVIGDLVLTASADHYYAIDRRTGAVTAFKDGPLSGGISYVPVVDSSRNQFYILADGTLTAYRVGAADTVSQVWQASGTGIGATAGGVALGPDGDIYCTSTSALVKLDPADGHTLASVSGSFSKAATPMVNNGYVFAFGPGAVVSVDVYAYQASDLSLVRHLPGAVGYSGTTYYGQSAVNDTHFVFDYTPGLVVYAGTPQAPEPGSLAVIGAAVLVLLRHRGRYL